MFNVKIQHDHADSRRELREQMVDPSFRTQANIAVTATNSSWKVLFLSKLENQSKSA
jgi:hypothetical protein